ncbi:MAG: hypothetical protein ACERKZ_14565 [Lachnotalea sp.]
MKSLLNESVLHSKFGKGKIVGEEQEKIEVEFIKSGVKKWFIYPDVFEKFLILENDVLQEKHFNMAIEKNELVEKEANELQLTRIFEKEERDKESALAKKKKKKKV